MGFSRAATWLDPDLKWKTLETSHFSIHYYSELEEIAQRFAPIAEEVHDTLSKVLKYRLDLKTQVVLLDTTDYGNGFTTVIPYPWITVYLTDLSTNLNPYKYDNYLRYLFLHEYVHALHLDIVEGAPSILRAIFGRVIFPNAIEPSFITEGLATYMETRYTNAGRGRDPRWEAMMRMDILENNLKSIDQVAVDTVKWPMGHSRYLYGVEFLEYLSQKYGEEKIISLIHVYGDFLFSLGIDAAFVFVYRKNLNMLWNEWLDYLREKYQKEKQTLGKVTIPQLFTTSGYYHTKPKWSKDGRYLYFLQRNADDYPQIARVEVASGKIEKILEAQVFDENFSLSPDGNYLLFSKSDIYKNFYTYKDLYLLDLRTRKISRLTNGERASDPAFSPNGQSYVYTKNEKGSRELRLWTTFGTKNLTSTETGVQYFSPTFSPDGQRIAVAKYSPGGYQKICIIDINSGREEVLNPRDFTSAEANPCFTPDGKYLLFDSDRTGIVNIYAYELSTKRLFQVTNVLGIATMPDVSPDGKQLAYVSYSSRGYDIATIAIRPDEWKEVRSPVTNPVSLNVARSTSNEYTEIHDYNPWPTLLPRFWIPYDYYNENGSQTSIYIGGIDPLRQHFYYLNFGYDFEGNKPSYTLYYANDQFLPRITLALSDWSVPYEFDNSTTVYWEKERSGNLLFSFFSNRMFFEYDRQAFTFGVRSMNLSSISSPEIFPPQPNLGNLNALVLAWRYLSTRRYAYSISPENGLDLGLKTEIYTPTLGSDYSLTNYSFSINSYFRSLFKHQVLALGLDGFYSKGEQLVQGNFSWRYLSLRGYPSTFLKGNKGISLSLEYRYPLLYPEWGLLYGATFFDRIWGDIFLDVGGATFGSVNQLVFKKGIGTELNFDIAGLWGYWAITLKLVYAKGLDEGGVEKVYITLGL